MKNPTLVEIISSNVRYIDIQLHRNSIKLFNFGFIAIFRISNTKTGKVLNISRERTSL